MMSVKTRPQKKQQFKHVAGGVEQIFEPQPDGTLKLVRTNHLTKDGKPRVRKFRLRPISSNLRNDLPEKTYKMQVPKDVKRPGAENPGGTYKWWTKNIEGQPRDPGKERVVEVDDKTARRLETMNDRFEEVFD